MGEKQDIGRRDDVLQICQSFYNPLYALQFDKLEEEAICSRVFYFINRESKEKAVEREYMTEVRPYAQLDRFFFFWKEKKVLAALCRYLQQKGLPRLIHAHTLFSSGYLAYRIYLAHRIPYVVSVRNVDVGHFFGKRFYLRPLGRRILREARAVIFISQSAREKTMRYLSTSRREEILRKSVVIPNGVHDFWIENRTAHTRRDDAIRVIYFGDLNRNKNLRTTVAALELLRARGHEVHLTAVGKLIDTSLLRVMDKPYIEHFPFLPKEELIGKIREQDLFVMPSFSETFGLSYVEAMSQGLPVIYSRGQGFDGLFPDGTVGLAVDPHSPEAVAEAILRVCENYSTMSAAATEGACRFSWGERVKEIAALYRAAEEREGENVDEKRKP